jgi:phosphoglycolate phosphatase
MLVRRAFEATGPLPDAGTLERETARYVELLADAPMAPADLYPGAAALVASVTATGRAAGLVTNKPAGPTAHALARLGLDGAFGAVVCGDGPAGRKPAAGPIQAALATLGVAAEAAVMVGDNAADIGAARAAGVAVVAVDGGYTRVPAADLGADAVVARLADVPAAVARLWGGAGA